jgi:hypothetical protein
MALDCIYTTLRNSSGVTRYFDYLPPHGRRLAAAEEINIPGDWLPWMRGNLRKMRGFASDLTNCLIEIVKTPEQHCHVVGEENDLDLIRTVTIHRDPATDEDVVVAIEPCWQCSEDSPTPSP